MKTIYYEPVMDWTSAKLATLVLQVLSQAFPQCSGATLLRSMTVTDGSLRRIGADGAIPVFHKKFYLGGMTTCGTVVAMIIMAGDGIARLPLHIEIGWNNQKAEFGLEEKGI